MSDDTRWGTVEGGMTTTKAPDGREVTTIILQGMTADEVIVGQRVDIIAERLEIPGVLARTMEYAIRDLEARGVR